MIYLRLFWSFFQIGLFSIGGGYAAMPLIEHQVVNSNAWLTLSEFIDIITISQMTPGPVAVNSATFVGLRIAGVPGAIIATLGCILPSCILVLILAYFYFKYRGLSMVQGILGGLRPAVVALIASAGLTILRTALLGERGLWGGLEHVDWIAGGLFLLCIFILRKWKCNPVYVMTGAGVVGLALYKIL